MNNSISEKDMFMLMMENAEKKTAKKPMNTEKSLNMQAVDATTKYIKMTTYAWNCGTVFQMTTITFIKYYKVLECFGKDC